MAKLHNVTFYVHRADFTRARAFYAGRLGMPVVFEEPGHICCFGVGDDLAICLHEAEAGHAARSAELFLWVDDGEGEIRLTDPVGNQIRLHRPPRPG